MSALGQDLVGTLGHAEIVEAGWDAAAVGGMTLGADPVAYAIARASLGSSLPLDGFTIRKKPKDHGRGRQIEGCFEKGMRVVVVEDVITTGGSSLLAINVLLREGAAIAGILTVVDREEGGRKVLEATGLEVRSILTLSELTAPAP
jgi:orotate phosphoribosyltransferase